MCKSVGRKEYITLDNTNLHIQLFKQLRQPNNKDTIEQQQRYWDSWACSGSRLWFVTSFLLLGTRTFWKIKSESRIDVRRIQDELGATYSDREEESAHCKHTHTYTCTQ